MAGRFVRRDWLGNALERVKSAAPPLEGARFFCSDDESTVKKSDIVMPWMVGRFSSLQKDVLERYRDIVEKDIAWCKAAGVDYVPLVFPGFSWYNLSRREKWLASAPRGELPARADKARTHRQKP